MWQHLSTMSLQHSSLIASPTLRFSHLHQVASLAQDTLDPRNEVKILPSGGGTVCKPNVQVAKRLENEQARGSRFKLETTSLKP